MGGPRASGAVMKKEKEKTLGADDGLAPSRLDPQSITVI